MKISKENIVVVSQLDKNLPKKVKEEIKVVSPQAFKEGEAVKFHRAALSYVDKEPDYMSVALEAELDLDDVCTILNSDEYKMFMDQSVDQQLTTISNIKTDYSRLEALKILEKSVETFNSLSYHDDLSEQFQTINDRVNSVLPKLDIVSLETALGLVVEDMIASRDSGVDLYLPTPFPTLNKYLKGLIGGKIYTFCASTGGGKTALAVYLSYYYATKNKKVLYITTESDHKQLSPRFGCIQSYYDSLPDFNYGIFLRNTDSDIQTVSQVSSRLFSVVGNNIDFLHTINPEEILSAIHRSSDYDIIILDHFHNIQGIEDIQFMHNYCVRLQNACRKSSNPVVLMAQYNKQLTSKITRPTHQHIKGSSQLIQCADVMAHIWRPDKNDPLTLNMCIEKNRDMPVPEVAVKFKFLPSRQVLLDEGEVQIEEEEEDVKSIR